MSDAPIVGGSVLRLVTAGLYDNPLVVYREYIQNSADAIASRAASGRVDITIDPTESRVTILDDGTGLAPDQAVRRLVDVGNSPKDPTVDRGFRGIGRLSALAFADRVHFTTRARAGEPVTQVTWDGERLRSLDLSDIDARTAVEECATVAEPSDGDWPHRFFRVTLEGITRHAASTLLNADAVRRYIREVCPVPFAAGFPLSERIADLLAVYGADFALQVRVNGSDEALERPFGPSISLVGGHWAPFTELDTRIIPSPDSDDPAAILWLAHTPYVGSIPAAVGIRGVRARVGNTQIGTEKVFEHLFLEPRFNGWCVGEVHVTDPRILPNSRRDYFEPGPHVRNLENHIGAIAHEISARCRKASSQRNKLHSLGAAIARIERAADLAKSAYLHPQDAADLAARERMRVDAVRQTLAGIDPEGKSHDYEQLMLHEGRLVDATANGSPTYPALDEPATGPALRSAFGAIAETLAPGDAMSVIEAILERLSGAETTAASVHKS